MKDLKKINILGVGITTASEQEILKYITISLQKQSKKYYIVTPNPEILVVANKDDGYKNILNRAKIALPDGIGVVIGARLLNKQLDKRITGVDFVKSLSNYVSKQPITVGFLGAGPNVANKTAECLKKLYPGLKVKLISQEWTERLKKNKVDILFVAFGSPKQEIFIYNNLQKIPAKVVIGVGGAFDIISGRVPRAPKFLQDLGLEWLFRLTIQPWRIKRQLSLIRFVYLLVKEKISKTN